jgi:hypothetical protein
MTLSITVSTVSSAVMLSVVMPTVTYFNCYAECLYAEFHYTECHGAQQTIPDCIRCLMQTIIYRVYVTNL